MHNLPLHFVGNPDESPRKWREVTVTLDIDNLFRPAVNPDDIHNCDIARLFRKGRIFIQCSRSSHPYHWIALDQNGNDFPLSEQESEKLPLIAEKLGVPKIEDIATIAYPEFISASARLKGSPLEDEGLPYWSIYQFSLQKEAELSRSWQRAMRCTDSFNAAFDSKTIEWTELSDAAFAILLTAEAAGSAVFSNFERIWMFRSASHAIGELVRGGFGSVKPEGFFELTEYGRFEAQSIKGFCSAVIKWREPEDRIIENIYGNIAGLRTKTARTPYRYPRQLVASS